MRHHVSKLAAAVVMLGVGIALAPASAHAVAFTDFVNFGTDSPAVLGPGATGSASVSDGNNASFLFSWLHDILGDIGGNAIGSITISDATLSIWQKDVGPSSGELWSVAGDTVSLGVLSNSGGSTITQNDYVLGASALAALQLDGLFNVVLTESTSGTDTFSLYQARLAGNYTVNGQNGGGGGGGGGEPVIPEPASLILLGLGLGSAGIGRRRLFGKA